MYRFAHDAMACTFEAILVAGDPRYAAQAAEAVWDEVDRLEAALSRYREGSEVWQVNAAAGGDWVRVGVDLLACLDVARRVAAVTDRAFDVMFDSGADAAGVGLAVLQVDADHHAVGLRADGAVLDLGGVAKGYALDRAAAVLADWGLTRGLVHAAESTVLALPGGDAPHRLDIRDPTGERDTLQAVPLPPGRAVAGSGVDRQGAHIRDPRTGQPATGRRGAWSIAADAATADALSTAYQVLDEPAIAAACDARPGAGGMVMRADGGLARFGGWPSP